MNEFLHWTNPDLEIKFSVIGDLGTTTEDYGFVKRQMGISLALYEHIEFEDDDNAKEELLKLAIEGEEKAIATLEAFLEESEEFNDLERDRFFPAVRFTVDFDNEMEVMIFVVVNERRAGSAEWLRFVALLMEEEMERYQLERS